jgi:hypothetical protein
MNWRRIASVTTGGKPYFFRADGGRSVVWHRGYRQYHATAHGQSLGFFDNVQDAKKAAEKAVGVNPIQRGRTMKKYFRVKRRRNPVFKHRGTRKTATMETRDSDGIHIRYHNTEIVTAHTDGRVTLRSGGWLTSTTKKRMNQVADAFALNFQVYQKRHNWFVVVGDKTLPFTDGMTFSPLKKNPKHRARRAVNPRGKQTFFIYTRKRTTDAWKLVKKTTQIGTALRAALNARSKGHGIRVARG